MEQPFVLQIKPNYLMHSQITKSIPVRFTSDQNIALEILKSKGFNKSKFIRQAVEEKLYIDFRSILKDIKKVNIIKENVPEWAI